MDFKKIMTNQNGNNSAEEKSPSPLKRISGCEPEINHETKRPNLVVKADDSSSESNEDEEFFEDDEEENIFQNSLGAEKLHVDSPADPLAHPDPLFDPLANPDPQAAPNLNENSLLGDEKR